MPVPHCVDVTSKGCLLGAYKESVTMRTLLTAYFIFRACQVAARICVFIQYHQVYSKRLGRFYIEAGNKKVLYDLLSGCSKWPQIR